MQSASPTHHAQGAIGHLTMKRKNAKKPTRYFPALNAAGDRFLAWQGAGLKRAVRLLMQQSPVPNPRRRKTRRNPDLVGHYDVMTAADVRPYESVYMLTKYGRVKAAIRPYTGPGANDPRAAGYLSVAFDDDRLKPCTLTAREIAAAVTAANIDRASEQAVSTANRSHGAGVARSNPRGAARRNPAPRFKVGDTVRDTFHGWTTKVLRVDDYGTFTLYLCEVPAAHWSSSVTRVSSRPGMLDGYNTTEAYLRAVEKNPAGWQQAEASASVRRAVQTGTQADRKAAHAALARLAARRKPSPVPNPRRRNPADPLAAKVTALRRAIRKAVASHEADGDRSVYLPVYRMLDKIEDFAWRNSMPFDGSPLRQEITASTEEGQARRHAYLNAEGERINAARRQEMNTPEARYAAEIQRIYGSR